MTIGRRGWILAALVTVACGRAPDAPSTPSASAAPSGSTAAPPVTTAAPSASAAEAEVLPNPCSGKHVALENALFDARCEISEQDLSGVRNAFEAAPKAALETTARLLGGGLIRFTVTNATTKAVVIPLMFHSAVDSFPISAKKGAAAALALHGGEMMQAADSRRPRPRGQYLAITLEAGAEASVDLRIVPKTKVESLAHCPPNAKCAPRVAFAPLAAGAYVLTIHGPFVAIRDDLSATVTWTHDPLNSRN